MLAHCTWTYSDSPITKQSQFLMESQKCKPQPRKCVRFLHPHKEAIGSRKEFSVHSKDTWGGDMAKSRVNPGSSPWPHPTTPHAHILANTYPIPDTYPLMSHGHILGPSGSPEASNSEVLALGGPIPTSHGPSQSRWDMYGF